MKRVVLAAVSAACLTTPAFANPIMKNSPNSAQVYGDGSAAQSQHQTAITGASSSTAYGGNVTVNVRGGSHGANGAGRVSAASGRANGTADPAADPAGGPPSGYVGGAFIVGGGGSRRAPDVIPPSIGGGGFDCPTVGVSPGGSGLGGGGAIGVSWISS